MRPPSFDVTRFMVTVTVMIVVMVVVRAGPDLTVAPAMVVTHPEAWSSETVTPVEG